MFQLYKKRDFSQLIGDTFTFFKIEGKSYFKNYFIINGGILLLLVVVLYFFMKTFIDGTFSAAQTGNPDFMTDMVYTNTLSYVGFGALFIVLISLASLINYSYPILFMKLVEDKKERSTENIFNLLKKKFGRAILFYLISLFILVPLFILIFGITILLIFVIVGIPILLVLMPTFMSWVTLSYYQFTSSNDDYFRALGKAFEMIKSKFWPIVGSTLVMYIIIQVILGVLTMIPYFIGIASMMTDLENINENPDGYISGISLLMTAIFIVSILFNYILQNLFLVNQGIIFYSIKETEGNISILNDIDSIGTHEE